MTALSDDTDLSDAEWAILAPHLVVDTQGLILHVLVHPADVYDRRAAQAVPANLRGRYPEVEGLLADMGYQGLASWLTRELGWTLLIVKRPRRWAWGPADQPAPVMPAGVRFCRSAGSSSAPSRG